MKHQIKQSKSSKLFYNKWPYKVECNVYGSSRIIRHGIGLVVEYCTSGTGIRMHSSESVKINKSELLEFLEAVTPFINNPGIQIRSEGSHFNLFCKDMQLLEEMDTKLDKWIKQVHGPTTQEEYNFMLDNGYKKILRDVLPKEKYQYRVYFKQRFPRDKRIEFLEWSKKHSDKIVTTKSSELWLAMGYPWSTCNPYIYVLDDKMLSMVGMYLSGHVQKVEQFILRSSVFTT